MTYDEADNLIRDHIDYGGSVDIHALAVAISSAPAMDTGALTLDQWIDLASRHANRDWNGGGYLESVQAVCADYARTTPPPAKLSTETVDKGVDRLTVTPAMVKAAMPWLSNLHHMRKTDKESNVEEAIRAALTTNQKDNP